MQWAAPSAETAEHRVFSFIDYLKPASRQKSESTATSGDHNVMEQNPEATLMPAVDPYGDRTWRSQVVELSGSDRSLNEFSVERTGETTQENLVMLHGYGAGLGFFYKNFEGLSRLPGWRLYALDLLGMGRSSRPPFRITSKDRQECIKEAEDWFIDALEEWRIKRKIDRFTLMGHSMGGYMAVAYALKYPGHLNKLVLASPVGIPEDPYAVNASLPEPPESSLANEITQDQEDIKRLSNPRIPEEVKVGDNNNFMNARNHREEDNQQLGDPPPRRPLFKVFAYLWDANISPFSLVRWSGPLGPRLVSGWTTRRFSHLQSQEAQALHTYAYSLMKQRGSGEYALAYILAPGAFARSPLIRRITGVGRQYCEPASINGLGSRKQEKGFPVIFIYGENDWMDVAGGFAAEQKLKDEKERILAGASPEEKSQDRGSSKVLVVRKAGHHVYLDGWEDFNEVMRTEMKEVSQQNKS